MGLFTREEKMNKETGKFEVTKRGLFGKRESSTPEYDRLHAQAKQERREQRLARKKEYREAYQEARHEAKLKRMRQEGTRAGSITLGDRLENFSRGMGSASSYKISGNYNPWGSTFDTGMKRPSISRSTPRKQVKKHGKKKKKVRKKTTTSSSGGWDMFDNYGYMRR
jgi:hypothetical protein